MFALYRYTRKYLVVLLYLLVFTDESSALKERPKCSQQESMEESTCPADFRLFRRTKTNFKVCFHFSTYKETWEHSRSTCHQMHADLASLAGARSFKDLVRTRRFMTRLGNNSWIGLNKYGAEEYRWLDENEKADFIKWRRNHSPNEDCVAIHNGRYMDYNCTELKNFICSVELHTMEIDVDLGPGVTSDIYVGDMTSPIKTSCLTTIGEREARKTPLQLAVFNRDEKIVIKEGVRINYQYLVVGRRCVLTATLTAVFEVSASWSEIMIACERFKYKDMVIFENITNVHVVTQPPILKVFRQGDRRVLEEGEVLSAMCYANVGRTSVGVGGQLRWTLNISQFQRISYLVGYDGGVMISFTKMNEPTRRRVEKDRYGDFVSPFIFGAAVRRTLFNDHKLGPTIFSTLDMRVKQELQASTLTCSSIEPQLSEPSGPEFSNTTARFRVEPAPDSVLVSIIKTVAPVFLLLLVFSGALTVLPLFSRKTRKTIRKSIFKIAGDESDDDSEGEGYYARHSIDMLRYQLIDGQYNVSDMNLPTEANFHGGNAAYDSDEEELERLQMEREKFPGRPSLVRQMREAEAEREAKAKAKAEAATARQIQTSEPGVRGRIGISEHEARRQQGQVSENEGDRGSMQNRLSNGSSFLSYLENWIAQKKESLASG